MPQHTHALSGSNEPGASILPGGNLLGTTANPLYHAPDANAQAMGPSAVSNFGGSQSHENRQPYLVLNFCIALQGIFPSQN